MVSRTVRIFSVVVFLLTASHLCLAAMKSSSYPAKTVRFIVPYAVGSGIDINARGIVPYVKNHLGVQVSL